MTKRIIYFDNAATTCPKPEAVYVAQDEYSRRTANPGRGAHKLALESARTVFETRNEAAAFLGINQAERLIFTPGCTYSINMALRGLGLKRGDVVVVSAVEHNAVMRPLQQMASEIGIVVLMIPYAAKGVVDMHALIKIMLEKHPRLCIFTEASNVTGELIDINAVSTICGAHKVPVMIDAAQTAGRNDYKIDDLGISLWCASGHKSLFGMPGVGLLYVAPHVDLRPLVTGGTGSHSDDFEMPAAYPDHLEAGTLPGPSIAALQAGIRFLNEKGVKTVRDAEDQLTRRFLDWAQRSQTVRVFGNRQEGAGIAVAAFDVPGVPCDRVAALLDSQYGIAVRTGLHCAPTAHKALGTLSTGLVRASFSCFNTFEEVDLFCRALEAIKAGRDVGTTV
jgi:cysteine desulfurase family protein